MQWEVFAAFAATQLLFAFSPGPAVLLTVSHGMRGGFGDSVKVALGVQAGNAVYFVLSALGLGALLQASETLFHAVKWIGAAYLIWLGLRTIRHATRAADDTPKPAPRLTQRPFVQAVLTQLANPKSVLFFGALMPQFIDPNGPLLLQYLIFGAICFCVWTAAKNRVYSAITPA